jgi:hypothetical protein
MLKKSLFVMAIVFMASTVYGYSLGLPKLPPYDPNHPDQFTAAVRNDATVDWQFDGNFSERKAEVWNWPASYDFVPICTIPVKMDVGFWIRVTNCNDRQIKLKQVNIHTYTGNTDFNVMSNVATEWGADWQKTYNDFSSDGPGISFKNTIMAATAGAEVTNNVAITFNNVNMTKLPPSSSCLTIGNLILKVRPAVKPNVFMSGCSGNGSGFLTGTYGWYAPTN